MNSETRSKPPSSSEKTFLFRGLRHPRVYSVFQSMISKPHKNKTFEKHYVDGLRDVSRGVSVLDIGCGTGTFLERYSQDIKVNNYWGIDPNANQIYSARRHYPEAKFSIGTVSDFDPPSERFQLIVCGALHHVSDEEAIRIMEFSRDCMDENGSFTSIEAVFHSGQSMISRLFTKLDRGNSVRTPDHYKSLAEQSFGPNFVIEFEVVTGLLRIPYSHGVLKVRPKQKTA